MSWNFTAPARPGDGITGRLKVIDVRHDKPITTLKPQVIRDDGTSALDGTAVCWTMALAAGAHRRP